MAWRDIFIVARFAEVGSPLAMATNPEHGVWGVEANLIAILIDQFNNFMWGYGGGKGSAPEPIKRPWGRPDNGKGESKTFVGKVMSQAKVAERLNKRFARKATGVAGEASGI